MDHPKLATVDPVDGTLYVIYGDSSTWAYRPPAKKRLLEGWRRVEAGPAECQVPTVPSSAPARSAGSAL